MKCDQVLLSKKTKQKTASRNSLLNNLFKHPGARPSISTEPEFPYNRQMATIVVQYVVVSSLLCDDIDSSIFSVSFAPSLPPLTLAWI